MSSSTDPKVRGLWVLAVFLMALAELAWHAWAIVAGTPPKWVWAGAAVILIAGLSCAGMAVNGRADGVLIDARNRVSLSKFQATLWTVLVVSSLMTAAAINLGRVPDIDALTINLPAQLLAAMGIAATSLVGAPIVLSTKTSTPAPAAADAVAAAGLRLDTDQVQSRGRLFAKVASDLASWADMFRGDEVGNAAHADLSKMQQFAITLLMVGIYGGAVWSMFARPFPSGGYDTLPKLSDQFVWLLGISHASYLTYKAVPQTPPAS
jgi:hypothetical protein